MKIFRDNNPMSTRYVVEGDSGEKYAIHYFAMTSEYFCSCPAFKFDPSHSCKHIDLLKESLTPTEDLTLVATDNHQAKGKQR